MYLPELSTSIKTVPWLRYLVAGLLPLTTRFIPTSHGIYGG